MKQTILIILFVLTSCNRITPGEKLSTTDLQRIKQLGILDDDEKIVKFYSEFKNSVAGNFFSNKRLASYWLDKNNKAKTQINSAFYRDIVAIDTVSYAGATYSPYMMITRKDNSTYKVCFDGERKELSEVFLAAINKWKENQTDH